MAKSWNHFDDSSIAALPTPVACALWEFRRADASLVALWRACDLVELMLRLSATLVFVERRGLPAFQAVTDTCLARFNHRAPTLGNWRELLYGLLDGDTGGHSVLPELRALHTGGRLAAFLGGREAGDDGTGGFDPAVSKYETSFTHLRNRLAHGAGLTHAAADHLAQVWQDEIRAHVLAQADWLSRFEFWGRTGSDWYALRGLEPTRCTDGCKRPAGEHADEAVCAARDGQTLSLWPLMLFGPPRVPPRTVEEPAVQVYSSLEGSERQGRIVYTPYLHAPALRPDAAVYWSQGDERARRGLITLFARQGSAKADATQGATESFVAELTAEAKRMMGRREPVRLLLRLLDEQAGHVHWLHGPAGVGKSTVMADVARRRIEARASRRKEGVAAASLPLDVVYRFRHADPRCEPTVFLDLIEQTLRPAGTLPLAGHGHDDGGDAREAWAQGCSAVELQLKALSARGTDVTFVIDGLDEMANQEPEFLPLVLSRLLRNDVPGPGRVTWLIAGRGQLTPAMVGLGARVVRFGETEGLPGLEEKDIWAMLLERVGTARDALFQDAKPDLKPLLRIPADKTCLIELQRGIVPQALLAHLKPAGWVPLPGHVPRAVARRERGRASSGDLTWFIDDDDDAEMYFAVHHKDQQVLELQRSRLRSAFVSAVVAKAGEDDAGSGPRKGLALYVKYVIDDILAGQVARTASGGFDPAWLPDGLSRYYARMMRRMGVGGISSLLTHVVCLAAIAREPLTLDQLRLLLRERLPQQASDERHRARLREALDALRSVLRERAATDGDTAYAIYHHSFREFLTDEHAGTETGVRDPHDEEWVADARAHVVSLCRLAAQKGLDEAGPLRPYVARYGVAHLLDAPGRDLPHALRLMSALLADTDTAPPLPPGALRRMIGHAADALAAAVDGRAAAGRHLEQIRAQDLQHLIGSSYETGLNVPAIRILLQHHAKEWPAIRDTLMSTYDIVFRHDIGEALSCLWQAARGAQRQHWLDEILRRAHDDGFDYAREVAGYALKYLFEKGAPVDAGLVRRYAGGPTLIDRMMAGEMLLTLALRDPALAITTVPPSHPYWRPHWAYLQADVDEVKVLCADRAARVAMVAAGGSAGQVALEYRELDRRRGALRRNPVMAPHALLIPLLGTAAQQFRRVDRLDDDDVINELAEMLSDTGQRSAALELLRVLACHALWNVTESVSSMLRRLVEHDPQHLSVIDELLEDSHWRVRYCMVDAAFNVGRLEARRYQRFQRALVLNAQHKHCRVRGICADDLLGWLRDTDPSERLQIVTSDDIAGVLARWLETADDSWLLEYLYLGFRFLRDETEGATAELAAQADRLLAGPRSRWLPPGDFTALSHGEFLRAIDSRRRAAAEAGELGR